MRGEKTAVIGLGLSGAAAAELLLDRGSVVTIFDDRSELSGGDRAARLAARGADILLGGEGRRGWSGYDLVIVSPGIPPDHPLLARVRRERTPAISEIELAARFLRGKLIAVTGTNGKTTTVSLLVEILRHAGIQSVAGGNIGYPLSRIAREGRDDGVIVAEISSFQLERIDRFRPSTAVFLNLAPDHLDRYPGMKEYGAAKLKIFSRQEKGDRALFPESLASFVRGAIPAGVETVTWGGATGKVRWVGEGIKALSAGGEEIICRREEIAGFGPAFRDNALAAAAAARTEGVKAGDIAAVLKTFPGIPHRLEFVAEAGGVKFYNDSKSTNPAAAAAALRAFSRPVIWLAGGSDKNLDFSGLAESWPGRVKRAIFLGETRDKLRALAEGIVPCQVVASLEEAVRAAWQSAEPGEVILLSPGCASFDMFENYRERGNLFKSLIERLVTRDRVNQSVRDRGREPAIEVVDWITPQGEGGER